MAQRDALGREIPDPTPVAMPVNYQRPESLVEMMRRMIRVQMSQTAEDLGGETFEEANDFDIPEEDPEDTLTRYQDLGSSEELPDATPGGVEPPAAPAVQASSPAAAGGSGQPSVSPPAGGSGQPPASPPSTGVQPSPGPVSGS